MLPAIMDPKPFNQPLALFQSQDKVLDIDQRIHENYFRSKSQKGWAKTSISAAKIPRNILYGIEKKNMKSNIPS